MVGEREQRVVARGVPVGPELGPVETTLGEERPYASRLLRAAAVRAVEASGETPVHTTLERGAHHLLHAEESCERQEIRIERGRGEHDRVAQLLVAAKPRARVVAQTGRRDLGGELGSKSVDLGGRPARERCARERLQSVAIATHEPGRERERMAQHRARKAGAGGPAEERKNAISGRQRAVDVEHRDGRARVGTRFGHGRTRLYTRGVSDGPEIFDDLYLGLQAGGALRKQRRGEELTEQEREAIGRWQQMAVWRKGVAIGAFAVGTFGLGFTIGGLIFGRWRKA